MLIDLRSDTITKPTPGMLKAMWNAPVGDDVFGEDPSVIALEQYAAELFGKEAALFCVSGTMTNQIAIMAHCGPGQEVICDANSHIYYYEGGGIMANSNASVRLLNGKNGLLTAAAVQQAIQPDNIHHPETKLVCLENTMNRGGGVCYNMAEVHKIAEVCTSNNLSLHLDGARIANAMVAQNISAQAIVAPYNSVSVCLSKGLGAPMGSLLLGTKAFIRKAHRIRKRMGGGWRQAGYMAVAGLYALENQIERLEIDHANALKIAKSLGNCPLVQDVQPVETNIVLFNTVKSVSAKEFLALAGQQGIKGIEFSENSVRFVTHLDVSDAMINAFSERISQLKA
jgi:threonine aldolase